MNYHNSLRPNYNQSLDLMLAAELQAALLPKACPTDCPHQVAAARNRMCGNVGGDFYDFIRLNDEQYAIVVGDVVGHGVRASLLMAKIMGYLRSESDARSRPSRAIDALNRMLIDLGERTNSTMTCSIFYAVIDAPSGVSFFVNAGHPRPFICDRHTCESMHVTPRNLLLGIEEFEPREACHTFTPGQRMVLFTDGIIDAADHNGERFGERRLHEVVNANADRSPDQCAEAVFQDVEQFRNGCEQIDDETIVVIDRV